MRILIATILFLNIACHEPKDTENCHYKIKFKNNTNKTLYIDFGADTILTIYSKNLIEASDFDPREDAFHKKISPYAGNNNIEFGGIYFTPNGRPMCIEDLYKPNEKLYVFVYDSIALGNKDWDEVKKNYLVTKRYDVTVEELRKTNFTIEYRGEKGYSGY